MRVLIIGGGGREHALAWKAAQSPRVQRVYVAPGNAGTAREPGVENVAITAMNIPGLLEFALKNGIELTIVGPEAPLVAGLVDEFDRNGLPCFGPSASAAQLEGSKTFSKDFLRRYGIPTGAYASFIEVAPAISYIREQGVPIVIKADGLAAGKGVIIAQTPTEAEAAVTDMLAGNRFGDAGHRVVVEAFLTGEEASFIVMCDGEHVLPLATSQDHKARDEGDTGPNTGGMGAYSPAPVVDDELTKRVMREVILPTVKGMAKEGRPYRGFLYAGLMISPEGVPNVLEFNCRMGDPETQPIMTRLNSDLADLCLAALAGTLDTVKAHWDERVALGVVMAAGGYPNTYRKGDAILGLEKDLPDTVVFHAGTREAGTEIVTDGGRVLCVCALGTDIAGAQSLAYRRARSITWPDAYLRGDIGHRAVNRS